MQRGTLMDNRAIGIFDSGLGGLTAAAALRELMPREKIIYFADSARVPYGAKSREQLLIMARQDLELLASFSVKFIIAACGTVTTTLPASLKEIGWSALSGCGAVAVEEGNTAFLSTPDGTLLSADGRTLIHVPNTLSTYTIPACVTTIESGAFFCCDKLTAVTIPSSVTAIKPGTFGQCSSLTDITIPDSVTSIGNAAFINCGSLASITIPASVRRIEDGAFAHCLALRQATILNRACNIHPQAFEGSPTEITLGPTL